jgi:hypothetical protein
VAGVGSGKHREYTGKSEWQWATLPIAKDPTSVALTMSSPKPMSTVRSVWPQVPHKAQAQASYGIARYLEKDEWKIPFGRPEH